MDKEEDFKKNIITILKRNFPPEDANLYGGSYILIDNKIHRLKEKKKVTKNILFEILEKKYGELFYDDKNVGLIRKSIKEYLDEIMKQ